MNQKLVSQIYSELAANKMVYYSFIFYLSALGSSLFSLPLMTFLEGKFSLKIGLLLPVVSLVLFSGIFYWYGLKKFTFANLANFWIHILFLTRTFIPVYLAYIVGVLTSYAFEFILTPIESKN